MKSSTYISLSSFLETPVDLCLHGERNVLDIELPSLPSVFRVSESVEKDVRCIAWIKEGPQIISKELSAYKRVE